MSDINILSDPASIAFIMLIFASPGIVLGAIVGALLWRAHRIWGCALGALIGGGVCLGGVWLYAMN